MSGSSFGKLFKISTFGESHGPSVGVVIEGVPPKVKLSEADIQKELDRRKPGQSELSTERQESDTVHFLSGVFNGYTTGSPLAMALYNKDTRPQDYDNIKDSFRPGHADWTFFKKYGIRDYRGSGRASGRETAARVAAGALARIILAQKDVSILAYTIAAAGIKCRRFDPKVIEKNPVRACDPEAAKLMLDKILRLKAEEDSAGGIIECRIRGLPVGLGEPVFDKFEADLAKAMLSIGAVKGFEIGSGFAAAAMQGSEHNDPMKQGHKFMSNNAGGVLGGITTGEELIFRVPVKPTSSIGKEQQSTNLAGEEIRISIHGRHDPIICPRIVPVIEAMAALVSVDHLFRQSINKLFAK